MDDVLKLSMQDQIPEELKQEGHDENDLMNKAIEESKNTSAEDEIMKQALSQSALNNDDDQLLKNIMEQSKGEAQGMGQFVGHAQSVAVETAIKNGFSEEQGIEAESVLVCQMGHQAAQNPDLILSYLMQNFGIFKGF